MGYFDEEGNGVVKDHYTANYIPPSADSNQDLTETEIKRVNGITTMKFKRLLDTSDKEVDKGIMIEIFKYFKPQLNGF